MTTANSSGNKVRLGGITKAGNRYLRQMLVVGAMAVIRHAERNGARRPWLVQLLARTATKLAAIALANKTARIVWALMTSGESYRTRTAGHRSCHPIYRQPQSSPPHARLPHLRKSILPPCV